MQGYGQSKAKRTAACVMSVMMLVLVLFSAFYLAAETDHNCTGEDCPVCACIHQCENALRRIGSGKTTTAAAVVPVLFFILFTFLLTFQIKQESPVSKKVRLNN